jgi:hypothetical protein
MNRRTRTRSIIGRLLLAIADVLEAIAGVILPAHEHVRPR